jgi:formylglycine-generating enzyme required for sulfatase activity
MRLLSAEPEDRFRDMGEVVRELTSLERPATTGARTRDPAPPVAVRGERAMPVVLPGEGVLQSFTNTIGMRFVLVEPGKFLMGSPAGEADRSGDEHQHEVTITKAFWLGVCPVTQGQWKGVMGGNPSYFGRDGRGKDRVQDVSDADLDLFPVERVSWEDAQGFLKKLSALDEEVRDGREYRLPSEAEWEYACRGGHLIQEIIKDRHTLPFHLDRPSSSLSTAQANFDRNLGRTSKVGDYAPNALGLFDMHGNVWEWCADRYGDYPAGPVSDPQGALGGLRVGLRVYRGGGWFDKAGRCRSAYRGGNAPVRRYDFLGFRVALVPPQ